MPITEYMLRKIISEEIQAIKPEIPELLGPAEVAAILGVSRRTLDNWRSSGEGPKYTKAGTVKYYKTSVAAFIEAHAS